MRRFLVAGLALLGRAWADADADAEAVAVAAPADYAQEAAAGIPNYVTGAYFAKSGYVFAISAIAENGDVYYHMNAPSSHSWYGVGFGSDMNNVRILISYLSANGHNVTNSCRMSHGNSEPVYDPDCVIENVSNDIYGPYANTLSPGAVMITHSICRRCAQWMGGGLDYNDTAQPFIYALGPNVTLRDNSPAANLRMHEFHGVFTMDMTKATNYTGTYTRIPAPQDPGNQGQGAYWAFANAFSSTQFGTGNDTDWAGMVHGIFMCIAFLFIFPAGAIVLRTMKRAVYHAFVQVIGLGFVAVGFAAGVYASTIYNKSKKFNSTHQIIGLLVLSALCLQVGLGFTHHLIYLRTRNPTIMGQIHRFLGLSILILAVVNAGLGWNFAEQGASARLPYSLVAAALAALFVGLFVWIWRGQRRNTYRAERHSAASSFVPQDYKPDPPAEYEMHPATEPFAQMGAVQPPRTPRWMESNDSLRQSSTRGTMVPGNSTTVVGYSDNPAHSQWQAVPGP